MATSRNWKAICERRPNASSLNMPPSYATRYASYAPKSSCLREFRSRRLPETTAGWIHLSQPAYCLNLLCDDHERLLQRARTGAVGVLRRGRYADGHRVVARLDDRGGRSTLVRNVDFAGGWFGRDPYGVGTGRQRYRAKGGEAGGADIRHIVGARICHVELRAVG